MLQLNQEKLKDFSFLEYLNYVEDISEDISHMNKSDLSYYEAGELARYILSRYVLEFGLTWENYMNEAEGKKLYLDEKILEKYSYCKGDREKRDVIREFRKALSSDLMAMIRERELKQNPDRTIEK